MAVAEIIKVERRRRWSAADKLRIVEETRAPGATVSGVAKVHGLHSGQLFSWRRQAESGALDEELSGEPSFAPVEVDDEVPSGPAQLTYGPGVKANELLRRARASGGSMTIELKSGDKIRTEGLADIDALMRVLAALRRS